MGLSDDLAQRAADAEARAARQANQHEQFVREWKLVESSFDVCAKDFADEAKRHPHVLRAALTTFDGQRFWQVRYSWRVRDGKTEDAPLAVLTDGSWGYWAYATRPVRRGSGDYPRTAMSWPLSPRTWRKTSLGMAVLTSSLRTISTGRSGYSPRSMFGEIFCMHS